MFDYTEEKLERRINLSLATISQNDDNMHGKYLNIKKLFL